MEILNNAEALKTLLGVSSSQSAKASASRSLEPEEARGAFVGDEAKLSGIGAAVQTAAGEDAPRLDRVAAIQQAIAAGTYKVDASKVADKMIDAMLSPGVEPKS